MWQSWPDYQRIALTGVELGLRVGVRPHEREGPQRVAVGIELFREQGAYAGGGLAACLDYDRVHVYLHRDLPVLPHIELLEELAEEIVAFCLADTRVDACRVTLRKLDVYEGGAVPALEVFRRRPAA